MDPPTGAPPSFALLSTPAAAAASPTSVSEIDRNPQDNNSSASVVDDDDECASSVDLNTPSKSKKGRKGNKQREQTWEGDFTGPTKAGGDGPPDPEEEYDDNDLEGGGTPSKPSASHDTDDEDDGPSTKTIAIWLMAWLLNNVALTLLNKATFAKFDFSYPFFLSFFHMVCNYIGAELWFTLLDCKKNTNPKFGASVHDAKYHRRHGYKRSKSVLMDNMDRATLDRSGLIKTYAFSVVFSLNIAIGNVSLRYVSVNFNQVMRSLVPVVAIVFGVCLGKPTSLRRKLAIVPVVLGVAMSCFGDFSITTIGFVFTSLCVVLAALKAVAAGEILTGELKLHPVDLLYKMAPKAAVQCLILSLATGEIGDIASRWSTELSPAVSIWPLFGVVSTGILSFSLNISSLISNKLTSPLTLCIAANVKQVLMIVLATIMFKIDISPLNGSGILVVLIGSAIYSFISMQEKTVGKTSGGASSSKRGSQREETDELSVSSGEEEGVALIETQR